MVPLSTLRDINFAVFYCALQYLLIVLAQNVFAPTHAISALVAIRTQVVVLVAGYGLVLLSMLFMGVENAPARAPGDEPGDPAPARKEWGGGVMYHVAAAALAFSVCVVGGIWLQCIIVAVACVHDDRGCVCQQLWGGDYAVVGTLVLALMQTQLLGSTLVTAASFAAVQEYAVQVYWAGTLYSTSVLVYALLVPTYSSEIQCSNVCTAAGSVYAASNSCAADATEHWISAGDARILVVGATIPVAIHTLLLLLRAVKGPRPTAVHPISVGLLVGAPVGTPVSAVADSGPEQGDRAAWTTPVDLLLCLTPVATTVAALSSSGSWHLALALVPLPVIIFFLAVRTLQRPGDKRTIPSAVGKSS